MKIKRDPQTLKKLRHELEAKPRLFRDIDKMSDEELADAVDQFMNRMMAWGKQIREAGEALVRSSAGMGKAAADLTRALERRA